MNNLNDRNIKDGQKIISDYHKIAKDLHEKLDKAIEIIKINECPEAEQFLATVDSKD